LAFAEGEHPMTVRQLYYALVSRGAIDKTEAAYQRVGYHVLRMRRCGVLPYDYIADNTRWMRKPSSYAGLDAYLEISKRAYRRAIWADQDAYVEVWCEKDALAGVLYDVTEAWDVPLMVTRGYPSESFVYEAADVLKSKAKPCYLYYFGDHDPSGADIPENTRQKLADFGAQVHFEVAAVLPWQIKAWDLPLRPTKQSDTRAADWDGGSVELDAIPTKRLKGLVGDVIERHLDDDVLDNTLAVEAAERQSLEQLAAII
jgi:hypothetical protein